ncbi:MAG: hypothetical protein IT236_04760 [Bacteroidia bacterium]|nr:hypothetical protein [Bacteroidia bacterium]
MCFQSNKWGNKVRYFVSLFVLLSGAVFSQKNKLPQITRLVYGECNDNCFKEQLQELLWNKDTLKLIFSAKNQCGASYQGKVLKSNLDTLEIEVGQYVQGFPGSKQSIPDANFYKFCYCYYRYVTSISNMRTRPGVIIINGQSNYVANGLIQKRYIKFSDFYKNQSANLTYKNLNTLIGKDYQSQELKNVFGELGNDSVPDLVEQDFRTIHFEEDGIYFVFSKENQVISIMIEKEFEGKIVGDLLFKSIRKDWLKVLGNPDKKREIIYDVTADNGSVNQEYWGCKYYYQKYKLFIDFDKHDNVKYINFSLKPPTNEF